MHLTRKGVLVFLALSLAAVLLAACAQPGPNNTPSPQPTSLSSLQPTALPAATPTAEATAAVVMAAKTMLAEKSKAAVDAIQLVDIQPVQWPDSCLGVPQAGMMCAMHVVTGYRVTLSTSNLNYEAHSNLDGSQMVFVAGPLVKSTGMSYSLGTGDQCQAFLMAENQDVAFGPCFGALKTAPIGDKIRAEELSHYIKTYQSFSLSLPQGTLNFSGTGSAQASAIEQRSIAAWAQIVTDETRSGSFSASDGLVIAWRRTGGLAGFCDELSVYATGSASVSNCKNGQSKGVGQAWLTAEQLTQLYQWLDGMSKFQYSTSSQATADQLTLQLTFTGSGSSTAAQGDMQTVETFAEQVFAQISGTQVSPNTALAAKVVNDFLTALKADPSGKSSLNELSSALQADIQSGGQLPDLLGIQDTFASFGITKVQPLTGMGQVLVDTTLNFVSPIHRSFVLVVENGAWRINTFIVHALPPMTPDGDFQAADQVILQYVQALQNKTSADAWGLLSANAQSANPQAGLEKEAQGFQSISAVTITLNETGQDQLTYTVRLWVSLTPNPAPGWLGGQNTRSFRLVKTGQNWQIDQIGPAN